MSTQITSRHSKGFTLIEVLVALAIFALVSAGSFKLISTVLSAQTQSSQRMEALNGLSLMMHLIGEDLAQIAQRPIRDSFGDSRAAFVGSATQFEFTHSGLGEVPAAAGIDFSEPIQRQILQRTQYRLSADRSIHDRRYVSKLVRQQWPVLDRVQTTTADETLSIDIETLALRYLSKAKKWSTDWPPKNSTNSGNLNELPIAVEMHITTNQFGKVRRFFQVGDHSRQEGS